MAEAFMATQVNEMSEHILIVEDDTDVREALCDALMLEGYDVVSVENGAEALRYLHTGARPCLILLDLMMPVMDGWTFRETMLTDPTLSGIPVVVMTAAGPQRAATVQANLVLHKPLRIDTVVDVVQEHCPDGAS
jgi:CheY-like chemotaxis protein